MICLSLATHEVWHGDLRSKKVENTAYERHLSAFLLTDDLAALAKEPLLPYPTAEGIAEVVRHPSVRARLPASFAPPLRVPDFTREAEPPAPRLPHRPAHVITRPGEWRSGELPRAHRGWWKFETAGHLGENGATLEIVSIATGRVLAAIAPSKPAGDSWRAAYAPAPREPAVLVARTDDAQRWFAFSAPVEMSSLSYRARWLAKLGVWIAMCGVVLGLGVTSASRRSD